MLHLPCKAASVTLLHLDQTKFQSDQCLSPMHGMSACYVALQTERRPPVSNTELPAPALSTHSHILSVPFISVLELNFVLFIFLVTSCAPVV